MDWDKVYRDWSFRARNYYNFKPMGYDDLAIYCSSNEWGVYGAHFYDLEKKIRPSDKKGTDHTAYLLLQASVDIEEVVAVYICATLFNMFNYRNRNHGEPMHFLGQEIRQYKRDIHMAIKEEFGYIPQWHHTCTKVYPNTLRYDMLTPKRIYHQGYRNEKELYDVKTVLDMSIIEAMLNSKYAIFFELHEESLNRWILELDKDAQKLIEKRQERR